MRLGGQQTDVYLFTIVIIGAILLVVALVLLRYVTDGKAEVRLTDAAIGLIPVIVVLFLTGKIQSLVVGPEGIKVEATRDAIVSAAGRSIDAALEPIEPEEIEFAAKGGVQRIDEYLRRGIQALTFTIGGYYVPEIMRTYFEELTKSPRFQYLVLIDSSGQFFGIMEARKLTALIESPNSEDGGRRDLTWETIRDWIEAQPTAFYDLNGFVSADQALQATTSKRIALGRMQDEVREWLPVVNDDGNLAGVAHRSRLTAGLILEVADKLSEQQPDAR